MSWEDELAEDLEGKSGNQQSRGIQESLMKRLDKFGEDDIVSPDVLRLAMTIARVGTERKSLPMVFKICVELGYRAGIDYCLDLTDEERAELVKE